MIFIWDPGAKSWVLYPHGVPGMAVRIPDQQARKAAELVLDQGGQW